VNTDGDEPVDRVELRRQWAMEPHDLGGVGEQVRTERRNPALDLGRTSRARLGGN
jgi:hypothetical protein